MTETQKQRCLTLADKLDGSRDKQGSMTPLAVALRTPEFAWAGFHARFDEPPCLEFFGCEKPLREPSFKRAATMLRQEAVRDD